MPQNNTSQTGFQMIDDESYKPNNYVEQSAENTDVDWQKTTVDRIDKQELPQWSSMSDTVEEQQQQHTEHRQQQQEMKSYDDTVNEKLESIRGYLNKRTNNHFQNAQEVKSYLSTQAGKEAFVRSAGKTLVKRGTWNTDMTGAEVDQWLNDTFGLKVKVNERGEVIYNPKIDKSTDMLTDDIRQLSDRDINTIDEFLVNVYDGKQAYEDRAKQGNLIGDNELVASDRMYNWINNKAGLRHPSLRIRLAELLSVIIFSGVRMR